MTPNPIAQVILLASSHPTLDLDDG